MAKTLWQVLWHMQRWMVESPWLTGWLRVGGVCINNLNTRQTGKCIIGEQGGQSENSGEVS